MNPATTRATILSGLLAGALNLGVGGVGGAVVGDSGAEDGDVGLGKSLHGSVAHLESGSHVHDMEVRQFPFPLKKCM